MKALAWLTLLVGVACTVMFVITGVTDSAADRPEPWLSGWMAGPIILLFVTPMLFGMANKLGGGFTSFLGGVPKAFQGAPIAMGTVVAATRTGLTVNDMPQLEILLDVETADGQSFRGMARQLVDLTDLAAVTPGATLPVRYLPGSTDGKVAIATDGSQEELQAAIDQFYLAKGHITPRQLQIANDGVDAQAVVLAMTPTGEVKGDRSVLRIVLRVTRPDGSTFDLTQEKAMTPGSVAQVQAGMIVRTKYLPPDESEIVILTSLV